MVSVYPNPLPPQELTQLVYNYHGEPVVNLDWIDLGMDDPSSRKVRKPYTITKSRESWSDQEHDKFLEALQLFDRDWKKIEAFVGSKTVIQIRSHAQKYFLKVQKNGTSEHVPPPRPKRKAAHPYPQKAPKTVALQATAQALQPSTSLLDQGYPVMNDPVSVPINPMSDALPSQWAYNVAPPVAMSHLPRDNFGSSSVAFTRNNSSCSNESTHHAWNSNHQRKETHEKPMRVMPDFAQVYKYIGSVFDPCATDHLQRLNMMEPIDVETAVMLMTNLSVNLASPEFENHVTSYAQCCTEF